MAIFRKHRQTAKRQTGRKVAAVVLVAFGSIFTILSPLIKGGSAYAATDYSSADASTQVNMFETARAMYACIYAGQTLQTKLGDFSNKFFDYSQRASGAPKNSSQVALASQSSVLLGLNSEGLISYGSQTDVVHNVKCGSYLYQAFSKTWGITAEQLFCYGLSPKGYTNSMGTKGTKDVCLAYLKGVDTSTSIKSYIYGDNTTSKTVAEKFDKAMKAITGIGSGSSNSFLQTLWSGLDSSPILQWDWYKDQFINGCTTGSPVSGGDYSLGAIDGSTAPSKASTATYASNDPSYTALVVSGNSWGGNAKWAGGGTGKTQDSTFIGTYNKPDITTVSSTDDFASCAAVAPNLSSSSTLFLNYFSAMEMQAAKTACAADPLNYTGDDLNACVQGATTNTCPYTSEDAAHLMPACQAGQKLYGTLSFSDPMNGTATQPPEDPTGASGDECGAGSANWILCPIIKMLGGTVSWIMTIINKESNYQTLNNATSALQGVWSQILAIANIAFALAFLFIIYSTATSTGLSNYNIKKILPRLVIAAILVNVSFYICAAAVDLSNIIGSSANSLFNSFTTSRATSDQIGGGFGEWVGYITGGLLTGLGLAVGVGAIISSGGLGLVLIAILTVAATLIVRRLLITVLIIISPIAFVLWMLPNTSKWFRKWLNEFIRMLCVYPLIMAVWGASQFLAGLVMTPNVSGGLTEILEVCLLMIAPLFAIIPIFKLGGSMLGKVSNGANKAGGKARDKYRNSDMGKRRAQERATRGSQIRGGTYKGKNPFAIARNFGARGFNRAAGSTLGKKLGWGGVAEHRRYAGSAAAESEFDEDVKNAHSMHDAYRTTKDASGNETGIETGLTSAHIREALKTGKLDGRELTRAEKYDMWQRADSMSVPDQQAVFESTFGNDEWMKAGDGKDVTIRNAAADMLTKMKIPETSGAAVRAKIKEGTTIDTEEERRKFARDKLTSDMFGNGSMKKESLSAMLAAAQNDPKAMSNLQRQVQEYYNNSNLARASAEMEDVMEKISPRPIQQTAPAQPAPTTASNNTQTINGVEIQNGQTASGLQVDGLTEAMRDLNNNNDHH